MSDSLILLTPLFVLLILGLYRFVGCKPFSEAPATSPPVAPPGTTPGTPPGTTPPPPPPPTQPPFSYENTLSQTAGIAVYWLLNETAGTIAHSRGSLSPGADGTYHGSVTLGLNGTFFAKDSTDRAPSFDGTTYIDVPNISTLNPAPSLPFSIELWVKPDANAGGTTQVVISSHQHDAPSNRGYEIALVRVAGQTHQQVEAQVFAKAGATAVTVQPSTGNPDDWRHIVLTYQPPVGAAAGILLLYASVVGSASVNQSAPTPVNPAATNVQSSSVTFRFGAGHQVLPAAAPENFYTGLVDNVAFYNRVLSLNDVQDHFKKF
jgi:hypothetical protein